MKYIVPVTLVIAILVSIGIVGFVFFTKRLEESKYAKESFTTQGPETEKEATASQQDQTRNQTETLESSISLQILSPSNGSRVTTPTVTIRGKTMPNAEVFVNDKELTADADGNFSVDLILEEDENPILVVANDAQGRAAETEFSVFYDITE
jgi:hypothetical protein